MKKLLLLCVYMLFCIANVFAQSNLKGEKNISSIGGIFGYAIESEKAVVGVDFRYNILDRLRLAPSILYAVKKDHSDIWYFNADAHYLARITQTITLYPIGGIGVSAWTLRYESNHLLDDILNPKSVDTNVRVGVNLGFGGEIRVSKDVIIGAEFRYNWTERLYNQAMVLARAAYYF